MVIKLRVDADKKQESLPLYIAFIIYNGNIRFSIFEMSAERTPDILSFYSSKIPCLGIEQQKFLRSDRTSVAPCGEHVARNQISLFCDLFHRRMTDDLEQLLRSVHFCSVNLRPYPYRRIFIPHLFLAKTVNPFDDSVDIIQRISCSIFLCKILLNARVREEHTVDLLNILYRVVSRKSFHQSINLPLHILTHSCCNLSQSHATYSSCRGCPSTSACLDAPART